MIGKKFLILKNVFQFLVIKALDPYWIRIRIGIQPKMLDPDPDEMNADSQPCFKLSPGVVFGALGWGEYAGKEAPLLLRQRVHRHLVRAARPHLTLTLSYHTPGICKIYVTCGFRLFKISVVELEHRRNRILSRVLAPSSPSPSAGIFEIYVTCGFRLFKISGVDLEPELEPQGP